MNLPGVEAGGGALVEVGVGAKDEEERKGVCEAEPKEPPRRKRGRSPGFRARALS